MTPATLQHVGDRQSVVRADFRIYPELGRSRLYYRVVVFQTRRALREYCAMNDWSLGPAQALCATYRRQREQGGRWRTTPEMGTIALHVGFMGVGCISHECTHAALGWAQRVGLDPTILSVPTSRLVSREEERFCVGLGELVRQVSCSLFDAGILVEPEAR